MSPSSMRRCRGIAAAGLVLVALTACTGNDSTGSDGMLEAAEIPVAGVDRIEVRRVFPPSDDEPAVEAALRLPTPFGDYAVATGQAGLEDVDELVSAIGSAHFLDTCGVTYDMSNPDVEVVLLDGDAEVARLGYYREVAPYGECEVPSRWVDEDWRLLALTVGLPAALLVDLD